MGGVRPVAACTNETEPPHQDSRHESEKQWRERAEKWLSSAMATLGVGSNNNVIKFWREHGNNNDESLVDGRYMVWFAKEILFGLVPSGNSLDDDHNEASSDNDKHYIEEHLIKVIDNWHQSTMELLSKKGAARKMW